MTSLRGSDLRRSEPRGGGRAGFTLLEILAVLGIISLIGGLSAGAFLLARRHYALASSAARVEGVVRAARTWSLQSGVGAKVVVAPAEGWIEAYGYEVTGEWGFDDGGGTSAAGIRGTRAEFRGGAGIAPGRAGGAIRFPGGTGYADCGALSAYDFRRGLHIEAWVLLDPPSETPTTTTSGRTRASGAQARKKAGSGRAGESVSLEPAGGVISRGKAFFLGLASDGSLEGRIGEKRVRSSPGSVVPGRWTFVALTFDGESLALSSDGIEREARDPDLPAAALPSRTLSKSSSKSTSKSSGKQAQVAAETTSAPKPPLLSIPSSAEPLCLGAQTGSFSGSMDDVRILGLVEPERHELGPRELLVGWRKTIRFDSRGRLDALSHEMPQRVILVASEAEDEEATKTAVPLDVSIPFEEWARWRGLELGVVSEESEEDRLLRKYTDRRQTVVRVDLSGAIRSGSTQ